MEIIRNFKGMKPCALALGNFDGLHKAHTKIIEDCVLYARENGLESGVFLFQNHTDELCRNKDIELLTTFEEKVQIIESLGVDFVFVRQFDKSIMDMAAVDFFSYLESSLLAKALFAGFDYTFGKGAKGNAKMLLEYGQKSGIFVKISDQIKSSKILVKSNSIRELIKKSDIKKANELLGREYFVEGLVVKGKQNGRKMGFPTANVDYGKNKLLPGDGVYEGVALIDGKRYSAMINIGKNPTFNANKRTLEAHILGYDKNLYEKRITIKFKNKIREEIKFSNVDELVEQIKRDIKTIENK